MWIDPRQWASLLRAYALFLILATSAQYGHIFSTTFAPWVATQDEATESGIWLQCMVLGVLLLPVILSQIILAAWLLLAVGLCHASQQDRTAQLANETFDMAGLPHLSFRRPRLAHGAVAQPVLVSLCGKPLLVLPRQGLAYFEHHVGDSAEAAFRSVIAHELGHLSSWDDIFFLPWFFYSICGIALGCIELFLACRGMGSLGPALSDLLVLLSLLYFGFYVIRRREAFCDSYSVMVLRTVAPSVIALQALAHEPRGLSLLGGTHFDGAKRLKLLRERGRSFLAMSHVDIGLAAFMYFSSPAPFAVLSSTWNALTLMTSILKASGDIFLHVFLLLMIAGFAVLGEGKPPRLRVWVLAACICVTSVDIRRFLSDDLFNFDAITTGVMIYTIDVFGGIIAFVVVLRVFYRWAVAVLAISLDDRKDRLVSNAMMIAAAYSILASAAQLAETFVTFKGVANGRWVQLVDPFVIDQQVLFIGLFLLAVRLVPAVFLITIWVWARAKTRAAAEMQCSECGLNGHTGSEQRSLPQICQGCGSALRPDFLVSLRAE